MTPPKNELITEKPLLVDLRFIYVMIASTAVAVATVLGVYYNFKIQLDKMEMRFNNEQERRVELETSVRDLEKRLREQEINKPR